MTGPAQPFEKHETRRVSSTAQAVFGIAMTLGDIAGRLAEMGTVWLPRLGEWIADEEAAEPIAGHQALLAKGGISTFEARLLATTIMRCSHGIAEEQTIVRKCISSILRIARDRSSKKLRSQFLLMIENDGCIDLLQAHLAERNMDVPPGLYLLHATLIEATRNKDAQCALAALTKSLAPHLPQTRGRLASPSHVKHYLLLQVTGDRPGANAYTYDMASNDYTDERTAATRAAVGDPDFNPASARRSLRRNLQDSPTVR